MRALVTGGARRLGARFVRDLARRGWDVVVHYHTSEADATALQGALASLPVRIELISADLAAPGGVETLVSRLGSVPVDLVIHSASEWTQDTWETASRDSWEQSHRLHGWTAVVLARKLAEQGSGHLITLLDARSRDRDPSHFAYGFAKRELLGLTRALALELAPRVRVNGLALGLALKPESMSPREWKDLGKTTTPLQTTVRPRDVLDSLHYLVRTPSLTGQILVLDGGRHLKGDLFGSL